MSDEELYAQYLKETGQAAPSVAAATAPRTKQDMYRDAMKQVDETDYGAAMNNALSMGGGTLAKAFPKLGGVLGGALEGGAMGAAQAPEGDRLKGFLTGGALQGGFKGAGELAKKLGKVPQALGEKLLGVRPEQAEAYAANPDRAEELYRLAKEDPMGLSDAVKTQVRGGLDDAFENVSAPALSRVEKAVLGKNVEVAPQAFQGTAAGQEINRAAALQPRTKTWNVPVEEKYSVSATPMRPEVKTEFAEPQSWIRPDRYTATEVPIGSVERSMVKDGPEVVIQEGYLPRGTQTVKQQLPAADRTGLTGKQALTAKRASQKAAFENQAKQLNPLAYNAKDDAEAIAASRLKEAIEKVAPSTAADNALLEQSARYSGYARNSLKNNPAAILSDSESLGSVPTRSMRQFMDTHGGTDLEGMAKGLGAGRAVNEPIAHGGFVTRTLSGPAGKAALRSAVPAQRAGERGGKLAEFLAPIARQTAVGGSRDSGPSAAELAEYEQYLKETGQK